MEERPKKAKFTREIIEGLTPEAKRYEVKDTKALGLRIRVSPNGILAWAFCYSLGGREARMTLGRYPAISLDAARARALELSGQVQRGQDPAAVAKVEKSKTLTLAKLTETYLAEELPKLKATSQRGYKHYINDWILPELGKLRLQDIGLAQVTDLKRYILAQAGKSKTGRKPKHTRTVNYSLAVLSRLLSYAEETGVRPVGSNPCQAVKREKEVKKHRFLTPDEVELLLATITTMESEGKLQPLPAAGLRLVMLTGGRYSEVLGLKWEHLEEGRILLPEHKTDSRGERMIYLDENAVAILKALPQHALSPFIFAGRGKAGTIGSSLDHAWRDVRERAGLKGVRLHDLRHTFASFSIASGLTLEQTGQLLGHSTPQTTKRYAHLLDEAGRKNVQAATSMMKTKKAPGGA